MYASKVKHTLDKKHTLIFFWKCISNSVFFQCKMLEKIRELIFNHSPNDICGASQERQLCIPMYDKADYDVINQCHNVCSETWYYHKILARTWDRYGPLKGWEKDRPANLVVPPRPRSHSAYVRTQIDTYSYVSSPSSTMPPRQFHYWCLQVICAKV